MSAWRNDQSMRATHMDQGSMRSSVESRTCVPSLSFETKNFSPIDRLEALNSFSRGLYHYTPSNRKDDKRPWAVPQWALRAWSLDRISAAAFTNSGLVSNPIGPETTADPEKLMIRMQIKGHVDAEYAETSTRLSPGQIHTFHPRHRLKVSDGGEVLAFRVPYDLLGYDPGNAPSIASYSTYSGLGFVAAHSVRSFFEALPTMSIREAEEATERLIGLFKGLLDNGAPSEIAYEALRSVQAPAMERYVIENIRDPNLRIRKIQAVFGVSRPTVYRAFEQHGGVARFVLEQRLRAAYCDLSHASAAHGTVGQVAERYCFPDASSLSRAFHRFFGLRPSEVIGTKQLPAQGKPFKPSDIEQCTAQTSLADFWNLSTLGS